MMNDSNGCSQLVECHPATGCAPAICVEDEGEIPVSEPKPFGMNSFLSMDDDDDDDDEDGGGENENPGQGARPRVEPVPPYDTSSPTNVNFRSEIIGTTVRPGTFLSVPDEYEEDSSETSSSDSELDFTCSPYDGVLTMPPGSSGSELDFTCSPYDGIMTTPPRSSDVDLDFTCSPWDGVLTAPDGSVAIPWTDSEVDFNCSPYDGILTTPPGSSDDLSEASFDSELDFTCSPYDGIVMTPPRFPPSTRRYGMPDMADLAQTLKDAIPEEGYPLVPTVSRRTGLCDVSQFVVTDSATSHGPLDRFEPMDDKPMIPNCDIGVHDSHDGLRESSSDADTFAAPHEGSDLMRRLLEELRDPNMDCTPRALSEDSNCEYSEDDEDEASVPRLTPTRGLDGMRQISPGSTSSTPKTDSDVFDKGPIYPLTPPARSAKSDLHKARMSSPVTAWFGEEVQVVSPTPSGPPPSFPFKAYIRTHRDSRSLLVALPRL